MLDVTPEARHQLHDMLIHTLTELPRTDSDELPKLGFRLVAGPAAEPGATEVALALDAPREGDAVVEYQGRSVLLLGSATLRMLSDLTLDVVETEHGMRLGLIG